MDNYFSQFEQFTSLPTELQSEILSEYKNVLSKTPTINKQVKNITKQSFLTDICTLPINNNEIENYLSKYSVDSIIYFYKEELDRRIIHIGALKYTLINAERTNDLTYNLSFEMVEGIQNLLFYSILKGEEEEIPIQNLELDLLTQYYIYRERQCDTLKPYFSKMLILTHLKDKYHQYYKSNYRSLLCLYLYLRVNLQHFPVRIPLNLLLNQDVNTNDEGHIIKIDNTEMTKEALMTIIINKVDELYQLLLKEINKLD